MEIAIQKNTLVGTKTKPTMVQTTLDLIPFRLVTVKPLAGDCFVARYFYKAPFQKTELFFAGAFPVNLFAVFVTSFLSRNNADQVVENARQMTVFDFYPGMSPFLRITFQG